MNRGITSTASRFTVSLCAAATLVLFWGCSTEPVKSVDKLIVKLSAASVEVLVNGQIAGSGAFVSPDGCVLTAAHYIGSSQTNLEVLSQVAGRKPAELLAVDKGHDIALLKIETADEIPFLTVSDLNPRAGQTVFVLGSPINRHQLLVKGTVASIRPAYEYLTDQSNYLHVWYLSAMTPRGLSGGNWVDASGEIVGVQSGWIDESVIGAKGRFNSGLAFIPGPEPIRSLIDTRKHADIPSLGGVVEELWTQAPGFQRRFAAGTEGIVIHKVRPGGPLEKAGMKHEDLIVAADGKKLRYRWELLDIVRAKTVGDSIQLSYIKPDSKGTGEKNIILDGLEQNWLNKKR